MIYKFLRARAAAVLTVAVSILPLAASSGCSSEPAPAAGTCEEPYTMCSDNTCYNLSTSGANCGACGNSCPSNTSCVSGQCACSAGSLSCGGTCISPLEDANNCGACGTICSGATPFCSQGACSATCALTACGSSCADTQTSSTHCGACNTACTDGKTCQAGACVCPVGASCDVGVPPDGSGGSAGVGGGGNTGGGPASGGGPATGGGPGTGGGDPGTGGGEGSGDLGGYHVHGDWAGFAFTFATEATITPSSFEDMVDMDGPYCVSGTVAATELYSSIAAVGFNVSQPKVEDAEVKVLSANGDGLMVNITINNLTPPTAAQDPSLRIQLEDLTDPAAPEAPDHRWCANVQPVNGAINQVIPWSSFNTMCWDGTGTDFDPAVNPLAKVIIYAPDAGPMGMQQTFDFCVNDIGPDNVTSRGTGTISASCPSNGTSWSQTTSEAFLKIGDGAYRFQSNLWNLVNGGSTLSLIPGGGFRFDQQSCNTTTDAPCSFPSVYIGTNAGGDARSSGFNPTQISAISSVPTCLGWSSGGTPASNEYNVSYDVWFNSNSSASSAEKFLMVWFRDPPSFQPGGMFPVADGVVIADQTWQVWDGLQHEGRNVISYVAPNGLADGQAFSFDLKDFMDDAVERGVLTPSQYLIAVMGGMEVWGGGQGASITGFTAQVQ